MQELKEFIYTKKDCREKEERDREREREKRTLFVMTRDPKQAIVFIQLVQYK